METDLITDEITVKVRAAIAAELRQPVEAVPLAARLDASELGIDSLGLIKLTVRIEELFDVTMPDLAAPGAAQIESVGDVARLVSRLVAARDVGGAS
jgi:acyl carrier protein